MEATAIGYGPEPATLHLLLHCDSICLLTTICNGLTFVPQLLDVLDACSHLFEFQLVDCARRKFACAGPLDTCLCLFVRGFISGARICWTRKRPACWEGTYVACPLLQIVCRPALLPATIMPAKGLVPAAANGPVPTV